MMRQLTVIILLWMCGTSTLHAQSLYERTDVAAKNIPERFTYSTDSLASYINKNFSEERAKVRAIYVWIVHHMKYNVYITFVSRNEELDEKKEIETSLKKREGVCRQFAMLFCALAEKVGIPAYTVGGYNKKDGVLLPDPHEWCTAKVNGKWELYDPTFDMGYVSNFQFVSSPKTNYFQLSPQQFIKTHMPFDPLWQLMNNPYTYKEFDSGTKDAQRSVPAFRYQDSIVVYAYQSPLKRLQAAYARSLNNGASNRLVDYYLDLTKANIEVARKREVYDAYQETVRLQNQAVDKVNAFIAYRKAHFKPAKKEAEIRGMIEEMEGMLLQGDSLIHILKEIPSQYSTAVDGLIQSIGEAATGVLVQKKFVEKYYATKRSERNALFGEK